MAKSADAFRTISEVAEWLGVQTHVLRFWESKFTQVKPVKRAGGRRYYRPADMLLLGGIRKLLHTDGLTIKGVQKILREEGMAYVSDMSQPLDAETDAQLDADLTARMDEDVAQPPIEAEVVPFTSTPDPTPTPAENAPVSEDQPEAEVPPVEEPEERPLPAFLSTQAPRESDQVSETEETSGLPFPPLVEDVPAQPVPEDQTVRADEPVARVLEDTPAEANITPAPPEQADTEVTDQSAAPHEPEAEPTGTLPSFLSDYVTSDSDAAATAPKPRIIDVPDEPDPLDMKVAPSALSKATRLNHLNDAQRSMIIPLLAQLTALRDQMASNRREPL